MLCSESQQQTTELGEAHVHHVAVASKTEWEVRQSMFELTEHSVPLLTTKFLRSSVAQWFSTEVQ